MKHIAGRVAASERQRLDVHRNPTLDSWQLAPDNRWVFRHTEELLPSAAVSRARRSPQAGGSQSVIGVAAERLGTVPDLVSRLEASCTDALLIERGGGVIAEWYAEGFGPERTHLLMSVSKSLCGLVVGTLIDEGVIEPERIAADYVAELAGSALGDATVQQLLDMTAALDYSEEYTDPSSEVQAHDRSAGWRTARTGDPADTFAFLATLTRSRAHGECFQYSSAVTDALGWVIEAATGKRYADVLSERLWSKLGADHDARVTVDRGGCAIANGGVTCTARDLARVGRLMLAGGELNGERIVSEGWVAQTLAGGNRDHASSAAVREVFPNVSYRNQWWSSGNERGNVYGVGIHGQYLWLDPQTDTVIVKLSTLPDPVRVADTRAAVNLFEDFLEALEE